MLKDAIKTVKKAVKKVLNIEPDNLYNYTTKESREDTVAFLSVYAEGKKSSTVNTWKMCNRYYRNEHDAQEELRNYCNQNNMPFIPAVIPDPYIHVESQINADMPSFEFNGRDENTDDQKAKVRQYVAQYVIDNNDIKMKNNRNERRLGKYGSEMWKIGFDYNVQKPHGKQGDIFVNDIDLLQFITDPLAVDVDDAEYNIYVYPMHRMKAARIFGKELKRLGMTIEEIGTGELLKTSLNTEDYNEEDVVQVMEFWFRQPTAGSEKYTYEIDGNTYTKSVSWEPGDIACSIQINNVEIKYIPLYWIKTSKQNKMYPFALGIKIPIENEFWGLSELHQIKELVDAADRELAINILNDMMCANDIIVMSDNSASDGQEYPNVPGAVWRVKPGTDKPVRLSGLSNLNGGLKDTVSFIRDIIKQVIGNFDVNMGDAPPGNVRTLGGLVQLKEQGNTRQDKKKAGTAAMWERILKLIDYTAIEFFDDDRLIFIGAESSDKTEPATDQMGMQIEKPVPIVFRYNSDAMKVYDDDSESYFYPEVDYKVTIGDGIKNSPSLTIQASEDLMGKSINPTNYVLAKSIVDTMNLPNRKEIKANWDKLFNPPQMQTPNAPTIDMLLQGLNDEEKQHLLENPELLAQFAQENGIDTGGMPQ